MTSRREAAKTNAMRALEQRGVPFESHVCDDREAGS